MGRSHRRALRRTKKLTRFIRTHKMNFILSAYISIYLFTTSYKNWYPHAAIFENIIPIWKYYFIIYNFLPSSCNSSVKKIFIHSSERHTSNKHIFYSHRNASNLHKLKCMHNMFHRARTSGITIYIYVYSEPSMHKQQTFVKYFLFSFRLRTRNVHGKILQKKKTLISSTRTYQLGNF